MTRNQYFVKKRSMKYINGHIFYEYVFDVSDDRANKFNTFVCYSFKNIRFDYDLKLLLAKKEITYLNTKIFINVIYDYEYSIRPCAFQNLLYLINYNDEKCRRDKEYSALMKTIKYYLFLIFVVENIMPAKNNPNPAKTPIFPRFMPNSP